MNQTIPQLLSGRKIYSSDRMNPPPAESLPHVIQFELTTGCSYNQCTFCTLYRGETFNVKSPKQFKDHVDKVWGNLFYQSPERINGLQRIFIGSGDALAAPADTLRSSIDYSIETFVDHVGRLPRRVTLYGNTNDIKDKSRALSALNCGGHCGNCSMDRYGAKIGLGYVYWGIESGSNEVLNLTRSGYTQKDIFDAGMSLMYSNIRASVTIIPGLGGENYFDSHTDETIHVLNRIRPHFVTFMGLVEGENSPYKRAMDSLKRKNKRLTPQRITEQTARMIEGISFQTTIGVHGDDVHALRFNPATIGSRTIYDNHNARELAKELRSISDIQERFYAP